MIRLQAGPTCGFYALAYSISCLGVKLNQKKLIEELIQGAFDQDKSYTGEIFDIYLFQDYIEWAETITGRAMEFAIKKIESPDDIVLNNGQIGIFPYQNNIYPHYMVIRKISGDEITFYESGHLKQQHINRFDLWKLHKQLPPDFNWKEYVEKTRKQAWHNPHGFFRHRKVYLMQEQRFQKMKKHIPHSQHLNMKGYMVILKLD